MENKKVGIVTTTRAEYGLLKNIIRIVDEDDQLELILYVTGTHLREEYGHTIDEIKKDGFRIQEEINILSGGDDALGISQTIANATVMFAEAFERNKIDILVVLGDRYELLPICQVAMNFCIPIAHISGGETTEGAIDEAIRHSVTKMSYLHFPSCELYRKRVIQLGESPNRVFNFGDVGIENIKMMDFLPRYELERQIGIALDAPFFCVTFHPVTLEEETAEKQIAELLDAINEFPQYKFIFTKSNADRGNYVINTRIDKYVEKNDNCNVFESLGQLRYLSLMKLSAGVIGNSSSGIIEAPTFCIPTINIGDRQKGRLRSDSIIDCEPNRDSICEAIRQSQEKGFREKNCSGDSPFAGENTSKRIVETIKRFVLENRIDLKKNFYDIDF